MVLTNDPKHYRCIYETIQSDGTIQLDDSIQFADTVPVDDSIQFGNSEQCTVRHAVRIRAAPHDELKRIGEMNWVYIGNEYT